jgi:hypothetical protein
MVPRNFDTAKLLQVRSKPLRVEQHEFASTQMLHQRHERNLGSISHAVKHRFAKESASYRDTIKAAGEPPLLPSFDRMCAPEFMQSCVALDNLGIDPGIFPFRARSDHFGKRLVDCSFKNASAQKTSQRVWNVKILQWQDGARIGRKPFDRVVLHSHGEDTKPIALKQKFRVDHIIAIVGRFCEPRNNSGLTQTRYKISLFAITGFVPKICR